ncbi:MAG TPA: ATP-binding protein [Candidatus Eisenbacteria bacterium]|nr:ATP-binding protein [Candidatus Eisenbacteria bacterium]
MGDNGEVQRLEALLAARSAELDALRRQLEESRAEVEGHEGLLKLAMEDMRRLYDDLLSSQSRLMQADKLATVGVLAAGIVHEINNPLMFAQGNLVLLRSAIGNPGEAAKILADCEEGLERIRTIVSDIRTFSRASAAGRRAPEDLGRILEGVLRIVSFRVSKKAEIVREFGAVPPVPCDAQQLSQVFLNLLVNAAQAIPGQGEIRVATAVRDGRAAVEISDTGSGIPPEVKERIFEPFFTTKDAAEGTGLGLSISADIVKQHGGTIAVESRPGLTKFTILLPLV